MKYNDAQLQAVNHREGPMLTIAGPGSGKTAVITGRVYNLIKNCRVTPSSILVVTFTRAAAREMKERFLRLAGPKAAGVTFGTFHGVFYAILRQVYRIGGENILSEDKRRILLRELIQAYIKDIEDETDLMESVSREISTIKNSRIRLENYYSASCSRENFEKLYRGYQQTLKKKRLLDFDDIMLYCYDLFLKRPDILSLWQQKFQYILIDEFQDINKLQYDIIRMLAKPEDNLFIVGDDDQSIYRFRGAMPEIMLNFKKDYPQAEQVLLHVNYRCSRPILRQAMKVIGNNEQRFKKELTAARQEGPPVHLRTFENSEEEISHVMEELSQAKERGDDLSGTALLFRTNIGSRPAVEKLMEYNLPFQMRDSLPNLYEHFIARDIMAYFRLAGGSRSRSDFLQIINRPNRYISREALYEPTVSFDALYAFYEEKDWMCDRIERLERDLHVMKNMLPFAAVNYIRFAVGYEEYLRSYAEYRHIRPEELYEILNEVQDTARGFQSFDDWFRHVEEYSRQLKEQSQQQKQKGGGITVSTLHSVKGLEYDTVYILDVNEGNIPYHKAQQESEIEEERRMFYVGMTRARTNLYIYSVKERHGKKQESSRFVEEILDG